LIELLAKHSCFARPDTPPRCVGPFFLPCHQLDADDRDVRISVIIPCHGGFEDTHACLESLHACRLPLGSTLEILVVDNASPDATGTLHDPARNVHVLPQPTNLGFAGGVNAGLRAATGTHLMVLNNDTLAAPSMVERLLAAVAADPRIAIAAPVSNHVKGPARIAVGDAGTTAAGRAEIDALLAEDHGRIQDVQTLSGLCMLLTRSWLERIGEFDERFGSGNWEDDDFSLRARLQGARLVIVRDAFLHHHGHRTFRKLGIDLRAEIERRRRTFLAKWRGDLAAEAYVAEYDGDLDRASALAGRARTRYPRWPDAERLLGRQALQSGDPHRARALLRAHVAICPQATETRIFLALAELECGDHARGLQTFRDTLSTCWLGEHELVRALGLLADFWLRRGDAARARPFVLDAHALAPDDAAVGNRVGVLAALEGRARDAARAFAEAAGSGSDEARRNLLALRACATTAH
jgi:GT2 family glycosyltransferase/Tfp pilus assembly protein PilF